LPKKPRTPPPPRPVQAPQRRASAGRSPEDQRRVKMLMAFAASGLVGLVAVIALLVLTTGGGNAGSNEDVAAAMQTAGCTLTTAPAKSRTHVTSLDAKVKYNTDPPSTGSHYFSPATWGFYTTPANPVQVVHNEEHGGVILWWGNKVPTATIDKLRAFYNESPNAMLGTPYAKLGTKVAITAWTSPASGLGEGHVAVCSTFNEDAFAAFRDAYRGNGPERYPVDSETPGT
jgi:hypothetical protein